jgi:hypothetical protein
MNPETNRYHLLHKQSDIKICSFTFSIILASYYPNEFIYPTSRDMNTLLIREQPGSSFTKSSFSHFFFLFSAIHLTFIYIFWFPHYLYFKGTTYPLFQEAIFFTWPFFSVTVISNIAKTNHPMDYDHTNNNSQLCSFYTFNIVINEIIIKHI